MSNYAYLRVSTDKEDAKSQKHGIEQFAKRNGFNKLQYVEDTISGAKDWKKRKIGKLITKTMQPGDVLVVAEISRLGRSLLQVLELLKVAADRELRVYIAKQNLQLDGSLNSKIIATTLGLVSEIERDFISMRTKEALDKKRAAGEKLGRPKGSTTINPTLAQHHAEIIRLLDAGLPKKGIARMYGVAPNTFTKYLKDVGCLVGIHGGENKNGYQLLFSVYE